MVYAQAHVNFFFGILPATTCEAHVTNLVNTILEKLANVTGAFPLEQSRAVELKKRLCGAKQRRGGYGLWSEVDLMVQFKGCALAQARKMGRIKM